MASLNKTLLIGNVGKDPEIRVTQNGTKKASFSLATTESYKDKTTGERKDHTEWHNVIIWGEGAGLVERLNIRKGISLYIEGKITYRSWEDPSGQKKYMTEIVANEFKILTPRSQGQGQGSAPARQSAPAEEYGGGDYAENTDDLPF